jgi:acyl-CoA thioester hydrolase
MSFQFPLRVYWEDTDAGGIVFYANYLKFFERARTEWLRALGLGQQRLKEDLGGMFVVSETAVRYLQPARLDDKLQVSAELQERGRSSLLIRQQAFKEQDAGQTPSTVLLCEGTIRIAWVHAQSLRPARIPTALLERLS